MLGWAQGKGMAFPDERSLQSVLLPSRIAVLSQTTQTEERFASFVGSLLERHLKGIRELRVINTLCNATTSKQAATHELARKVDLMIVVGGRESANTRHLAEVARAEGVETHQIESASQIDAGMAARAAPESALPPAPRPRTRPSTPSSPGSRSSPDGRRPRAG